MQILGYDPRTVMQLQVQLERGRLTEEFELDLKKDSLELLSSFESPMYETWKQELEQDIERREKALSKRSAHESIYNYVLERPAAQKRKRTALDPPGMKAGIPDPKRQKT